jgi:hypothetical protein
MPRAAPVTTTVRPEKSNEMFNAAPINKRELRQRVYEFEPQRFLSHLVVGTPGWKWI